MIQKVRVKIACRGEQTVFGLSAILYSQFRYAVRSPRILFTFTILYTKKPRIEWSQQRCTYFWKQSHCWPEWTLASRKYYLHGCILLFLGWVHRCISYIVWDRRFSSLKSQLLFTIYVEQLTKSDHKTFGACGVSQLLSVLSTQACAVHQGAGISMLTFNNCFGFN